jgi:glycosyltransferase involved in cell wall biosynthesis
MTTFSVIIPTFNRSKEVLAAIESVMIQTYPALEIIVVDDGSTDDTKQSLTKWVEEGKIKYHYQINKGVCAARNLGASVAQGSYLVFLDSDDVVLQNWLLDFKQLTDQCFDVCYCSMTIEKPNGALKKTSCLDPYSNGGKDKGISIPGTWAIEKKLFEEVGGFDEAIKYGENTELKFRLLEKQVSFGYIDHYHFIYTESTTGGSKQTANKLKSNLHILSKHYSYFSKHPEVKRLFLQVAAVSAAKLGQYQQAHALFVEAWKAEKSNLKLLIQCIITIHPFLTKLKWKPISTNIQ